MNLILRLRKKDSEKFVEYPLDDEQYDLDELQGMINYAIEHKIALTLAVDMPRKKFVKWNPSDMTSISAMFEYA